MTRLGQRLFEERAPLGKRRLGMTQHLGKRHYIGARADSVKDDLAHGMHFLLNRSEAKGIVDHESRSKAMGSDISKKLSSLMAATGKDLSEAVAMVGEKSKNL